MKRTVAMLLCLLLTASLLLLTACGDQTELQDGYYTAQAAEFSHGWKEYITILVKGGDIKIGKSTRLNSSHIATSRMPSSA